jgi:hypothetical protein
MDVTLEYKALNSLTILSQKLLWLIAVKRPKPKVSRQKYKNRKLLLNFRLKNKRSKKGHARFNQWPFTLFTVHQFHMNRRQTFGTFANFKFNSFSISGNPRGAGSFMKEQIIHLFIRLNESKSFFMIKEFHSP